MVEHRRPIRARTVTHDDRSPVAARDPPGGELGVVIAVNASSSYPRPTLAGCHARRLFSDPVCRPHPQRHRRKHVVQVDEKHRYCGERCPPRPAAHPVSHGDHDQAERRGRLPGRRAHRTHRARPGSAGSADSDSMRDTDGADNRGEPERAPPATHADERGDRDDRPNATRITAVCPARSGRRPRQRRPHVWRRPTRVRRTHTSREAREHPAPGLLPAVAEPPARDPACGGRMNGPSQA
jgi:hypothetical protein